MLNPNLLNGTFPDYAFVSLVAHEIGHCLGFGTLWKPLGLQNESSDPHFLGVKARRWFNLSGGSNYRGKKVPTEAGSGHWRRSVFGDELMIDGCGPTNRRFPL